MTQTAMIFSTYSNTQGLTILKSDVSCSSTATGSPNYIEEQEPFTNTSFFVALNMHKPHVVPKYEFCLSLLFSKAPYYRKRAP